MQQHVVEIVNPSNHLTSAGFDLQTFPDRHSLASDACCGDGVHLDEGSLLHLRHVEGLLLGHGPGQAPAGDTGSGRVEKNLLLVIPHSES